jgi:hypothetical protein
MKSKLLTLIVLSIILIGCRQPVKEARGYAIRQRAQQAAADQEARRAYSEASGEIRLRESEATSDDRIAARERFIWWSSLAAVFSVAILTLALVSGTSYTVIGASRAMVTQFRLKAQTNLIALDKGTRQFPLIAAYAGKGIIHLHNPNTGGVYTIDTRQPPDAQMIAGASLTQCSGAIAQEAKGSRDPSGVAVVAPPVVVEMERK